MLYNVQLISELIKLNHCVFLPLQQTKLFTYYNLISILIYDCVHSTYDNEANIL